MKYVGYKADFTKIVTRRRKGLWLRGSRRKTPGGIDGVSFQSLTYQYVEDVFQA